MSDQTVQVALLTTSFPLKAGSVSGVFIRRLVKSLPASVLVTVVTPCNTSPAHDPDGYKLHCFRYAPWNWQLLAHQPGGIPVALKRIKAMRWLLPIFIGAMFVACFRVSKKADVIHANWSVNGAVAGLVGFLLRKPVVTTLRGEDVERAKSSTLYRYLLVWCLRSNYKLITVSEAIYSLLYREFPHYRQKISFLPNGVSSELLGTSINKTKPNKRAIFRLLSVGSLIPRKGVETIVNALSNLLSPQKYRLLIVGDGVELNNLKDLVKKKSLGEIVEFVGQVPPEMVIKYLCNTDAFILASYSEGRPNVVLESFAAGVPVIASKIEGVRELVKMGETGLLFHPGNAGDLAMKLETLRQNYELQIRFAKRGREFIIKNQLLWPCVGQQYADLYKEAIEKNESICAG